MSAPTRITITGAAGQLGYALAFRVASGAMLGSNQPMVLQLLEIPAAMDALRGVVMEIHDCAFPLLQDVVATDDPKVAFKDADIALLVGARPRGPGMERGDLLAANAAIFSAQGQALDAGAARDVKVLVVGNPANTNCLIAQRNAPNLNPRNFTAMTRLDHNRALAQLAAKTGVPVTEIEGLAIWGNHSPTMYPDLHHATVGGRQALARVDVAWMENEFLPTVQKRGAAIIDARGASSAASAASAAIDHMRDWVCGSAGVVSMGVPSDGAYDIAEGLIFSYPVVCANGDWRIVGGLGINEFSRAKLAITEAELKEERAEVVPLLP